MEINKLISKIPTIMTFLRANKIGIIYQQDNLLPDFTALENVYLANLAIEKNKEVSLIKSKQLLRKVGLIKSNLPLSLRTFWW